APQPSTGLSVDLLGRYSLILLRCLLLRAAFRRNRRVARNVLPVVHHRATGNDPRELRYNARQSLDLHWRKELELLDAPFAEHILEVGGEGELVEGLAMGSVSVRRNHRLDFLEDLFPVHLAILPLTNPISEPFKDFSKFAFG